jgi:hypothetical protein
MISPYLSVGDRACMVYLGCRSVPGEEFALRSYTSRSQMLKTIEAELSNVRNMANHPEDEVLRYFIDMSILEVRNKLDRSVVSISDRSQLAEEGSPRRNQARMGRSFQAIYRPL